MLQHGYQSFVNLMTSFFSKKKVIKYSIFIFIFHICAKFQTKKKGLIVTSAFECFQSHCHIFKKIHVFFMGAITIVGESSFIFSFVSYGLVTKSLGVGCTFEEVAQRTNCQKMNVNIFTIKLG
jgi:hypothetical protein